MGSPRTTWAWCARSGCAGARSRSARRRGGRFARTRRCTCGRWRRSMLAKGEIETPLGGMVWVERDGAVTELRFGDVKVRDKVSAKVSATVKERLKAYFDGDLKAIDRIRVELDGTPFQKRVWDMLR